MELAVIDYIDLKYVLLPSLVNLKELHHWVLRLDITLSLWYKITLVQIVEFDKTLIRILHLHIILRLTET